MSNVRSKKLWDEDDKSLLWKVRRTLTHTVTQKLTARYRQTHMIGIEKESHITQKETEIYIDRKTHRHSSLRDTDGHTFPHCQKQMDTHKVYKKVIKTDKSQKVQYHLLLGLSTT